MYCAIPKCTIFDESQPTLGYPLNIKTTESRRYLPTPVIELILYDIFIEQILNASQKLENYQNVKFKSSFGKFYSFWIPIYINEDHWKRSYRHILNAIATVSKGFAGTSRHDFKPYMVLDVMPLILHEITAEIVIGRLHKSIAAFEANFHFYRLSRRLIVEFPSLQNKIDREVELLISHEFNHNRSNQPMMEELIIKLAMSSYGTSNAFVNEFLIE